MYSIFQSAVNNKLTEIEDISKLMQMKGRPYSKRGSLDFKTKLRQIQLRHFISIVKNNGPRSTGDISSNIEALQKLSPLAYSDEQKLVIANCALGHIEELSNSIFMKINSGNQTLFMRNSELESLKLQEDAEKIVSTVLVDILPGYYKNKQVRIIQARINIFQSKKL